MIFSVIGQPDLRLGLQLLIKAVAAIKKRQTKNIFFIVLLLKLKNLILHKYSPAKVIDEY
jgi:hypothetical protein